MSTSDEFHVYDTTLRDGAQQEGLALSVADKIAIAQHLDDLGVGFIEGGWPGAVPKDTEFFARARTELHLRHATFAAFGATRKPETTAADDQQVAALRDSGASVVTLVAKSHDAHVERALRTTLDENLKMVADTVQHLREHGQRVFLDTEHFFDGYRANRAYALEVVRVAAEAGADVVALCDTNGGTLPRELQEIVRDVLETTGARLGIHAHNDGGCAVANSIAAVEATSHTRPGHHQRVRRAHRQRGSSRGGRQPRAQTRHGAPAARQARRVVPDRPRDRRSDERAAVDPAAVRRCVRFRPQGGTARQRHQGGSRSLPAHGSGPGGQRHAHARLRDGKPGDVELKGRELGFDLGNDRDLVSRVTDRVKEMESRGYTFEAADASFELLLTEEVTGSRASFFDVESWRVITESRADGEAVSESTVKLVAGGEREIVTGEGNGPVNALDHALRTAIERAYPVVNKFELVDYKVRILDQGHGTDAVIRVLIETADGEGSWFTVGVGHNIVEASWEALVDGFTYGLLRHKEVAR